MANVMSKITISTRDLPPTDNARLIYALKNATGKSLTEVRRSLSSGPANYLFRAELYLNNHVEVAATIREILRIFDNHQIQPYILEIPYDQSWDDPINETTSEITTVELLSILAAADGQFQ